MKALITRDTFIKGEPVAAGKHVDVEKSTFIQLVQAGKAEEAAEPDAKTAKQPNKKGN